MNGFLEAQPLNTRRCLSVCLSACLPACLSCQLALFTHKTSTDARVAPVFLEQLYMCILYVYKCTGGVQKYNCSNQSVCAASLHCASSTTFVVLVF